MTIRSHDQVQEARNPPVHTIPLVLIAAIVALGGWILGYDSGIISGTELLLRRDLALTPLTEELAISASLIGAIPGAALGGTFSNWVGRKKAIQVQAALFAAGALLTAVAPHYVWFVVFRLLVGLSAGLGALVIPVYLAEMSPKAKRGRYVSFNRLALALALPVAYGIYIALSHLGVGWRPLFASESLPAVLLFIAMFFLPESPRWLGSKGRWQEAKEALERVRGEHEDEEVASLRMALTRTSHTSWREWFTHGLWMALVVGCGLGIFQQLVGSAAISYYTPTIFKFAGFRSASLDVLITAMVGVVSLIATILAVLFLDRLGRRPLLLVSFTGMALTLLLIGCIFTFGGGPYLVLVCLLVYILAYSCGVGPIFSLMCAEIFPTRLRGTGVSIAMLANWSVTVLVSLSFLTFVNHLGKPLTFWSYALMAMLGTLFCWFLVPETKGKSLEQVEAYWKNGRHWS